MVYVLPGVKVSSNKPATVIFPRGDKSRHAFDWIFTVTFEVMKMKSEFLLKLGSPVILIISTRT